MVNKTSSRVNRILYQTVTFFVEINVIFWATYRQNEYGKVDMHMSPLFIGEVIFSPLLLY